MRAVRRLGFRRAAASDDPRLRRVSCIDRGCAAALPESFSLPIVGSCRPGPGRRRLCRGPGRMLGRHRKKERCGAGQSLATRPGAAPERDGRGDRTPVHCQAFRRPGPPPLPRRTVCTTGRLFNCKRCRSQVIICRSCDRGQVYCSKACSARSRTERRREARARYRRTEKGRETGRRRQRRYRIRLADLARAAARIVRITGTETAVAVLPGGVPAAPGDAGSEKTVTDHPSGPLPAPLAAVPTARKRRGSPLRCAVCGRIVTHVVLADP